MRDSQTGDVILKLVNGESTPQSLALRFSRIATLPATATRTVFGGTSADAANEDGTPPAVDPPSSPATTKVGRLVLGSEHTATGVLRPLTSEIPLSRDLTYEAPANSLTILRLRTK